MNLHQAFLRAICEDPADDTPRLVFADWLEENGEADRAEVIRLECTFASDLAVARRQDGVGSMRCQLQWYQFWHRRESLPWQTTYRDWRTADFQGWPGPEGCGYEWERGFVAAISLKLADFLIYAVELFSGAPITHVRLTDREPTELPAERLVGQRAYVWLHGQMALSDSLPAMLVSRLCGGDVEPWPTPARAYVTAAAAHADLSAACVAWGRERAGLPPLSTAALAEPAAHV